MALVVAEGLTKHFNGLAAVEDLSFEVEAGTVTGCLGPNGAGKTTTLRMLLGLVTPTAGTATIAGRPYHQLDEPKATVGALLEASGFHPGRSAANHLRVITTAAGLPQTRVDEVLAEVDLADAAGRRVGGFSLGMRQRLGLAAALLGRPRVLVLDEPGNGLDPEGIRWLRGFLRHYAAEGGTVLVSSHALAEVSQTVDRVVIMTRGRLVAHTTLEELTSQGNLEDVFLELTSPARPAPAVPAGEGDDR
ncbi:MAG TPA: ATP-binding cassette domain-containing protein [Acidimicrobiales bacterium]|jgi:ABC-2 type transport system ATP-binding protein|nr:ATP-binding cassette domain-containing protein [Acidimicrobiales bacterium]